MQARQHRWAIDESEYERHEQRRGRRHAFVRLVPEKTALVVIDMVPFFVDTTAYARGIVPNVNHLATTFRAASATVAWVVPDPDPFSALTEEFFGPEIGARYQSSGGEGTISERIWHGLHVAPDDLYATKTASSAFFPGRCNLHDQLRHAGVENVVVTGTVAGVCVESSARDARTLGYRVVAAADAIAAPSDDMLNATLRTLYRSFGDVRSTQEIQGLLD